MSDNSVSHYTACADCVACTECAATAYCLSEPNPLPPCPHNHPLCGECLDTCPDCRRTMEEEMYRTGVYNPLADPGYRPKAKAADDAFAASRQGTRYGGVRYPETGAS